MTPAPKLAIVKDTPAKGARRRRANPFFKIAAKMAPAGALGSVIFVLLYLSLSHLARGIELLTKCTSGDGMAMAIGLDLLIVSLEVAEVYTAGSKSHKQVAKWATPALFIAFSWSAALNAYAFSDAQAIDTWEHVAMKVAAGLLGLFIPVLIYLATRAWAAMAITAKKV